MAPCKGLAIEAAWSLKIFQLLTLQTASLFMKALTMPEI